TLAEYLGAAPLAPAFFTPGGTDYAFGGATVLADGRPGSLSPLAPKLPTQVGAYLLGNSPAANDLFVLLGGANDFFDNPAGTPADVADALIQSVEAVIAAGGKRFLIGNLPLLGNTPLFSADPMSAAGANLWTAGFNAELEHDLATMPVPPGVTVLE